MDENWALADPFPMPSRPGQRQRYDRVIAATIHLADEGGFDGVQMRSVSERSDVALGTVYKYFQSRDNLVYRAAVMWSRGVVERAYQDEASPTGDNFEADVLHLLRLHAEQPRLLDAFIRSSLTRDPEAMQARRATRWGWWLSPRPDFGILGAHLAPIAPQILDDVFFAAAVRWAFGDSTIEEVIERVRETLQALLRASRHTAP